MKNAKEELERLIKGNQNFVNSTPEANNKCLETLQKFAHYQEPRAMVLSCSDSRVVPEIIFDVGIGELFVVRTAGIGIGPNILESIEFGYYKLKLPLLVLLGHDDCGVMTYAMEMYPAPLENFNALMRSVYPVLGDKNDCPNDIAKKHTRLTKQTLLENSTIIKEAHDNNKLMIIEAHFDFETGLVNLI